MTLEVIIIMGVGVCIIIIFCIICMKYALSNVEEEDLKTEKKNP